MTTKDELRMAIDQAERATKELAKQVAKAREELQKPHVPPRVDIGMRCPVSGCGEALALLSASEKADPVYFADSLSTGGGSSVFYGWKRVEARGKWRCDAGHVITAEFIR